MCEIDVDKMFFFLEVVTLSEDFLINCWDSQGSGEPIQASQPSEAEMSMSDLIAEEPLKY